MQLGSLDFKRKNCNLIYKEYEHSAVLKPIYAFQDDTPKERNGYVQMLVQNIYGEIFEIPERQNEDDLIFMDVTGHGRPYAD